MARPLIPGVTPARHINTRALFSTKRPRRTIPEEAANRASTSQAPKPGPEAEGNARRAPDAPPTEDVDGLSATNAKVESAMNHRRCRTVLHDACFSPEAMDEELKDVRIQLSASVKENRRLRRDIFSKCLNESSKKEFGEEVD